MRENHVPGESIKKERSDGVKSTLVGIDEASIWKLQEIVVAEYGVQPLTQMWTTLRVEAGTVIIINFVRRQTWNWCQDNLQSVKEIATKGQQI